MKNWTVLIYANGNNEMQPEMWQAKQAVQRIGSNQDVNVVVQISQIEDQLVRIIRPFYNSPDRSANWVGARRIYLIHGVSILLQDLGKINMADPAWLYDFIKWGMANYSAKHYVLILSGHAFQLIGAMPDYSQDTPYIMGIQSMVQSINSSCKGTNKKIDILILDVCSFNFIEVMYEFGKNPNHAVQHIITYFNNGPLQGMPYDKFIQILHKNSLLTDINHLTRLFFNKMEHEVIAIKIDHDKLKLIKKSFNNLAACYLKFNNDKVKNLSELIYGAKTTDQWYEFSACLKQNLTDIILCDNKPFYPKFKLLYFANSTKNTQEYIDLYCRLSFAVNNHWTYLLSREKHFPFFHKTRKFDLRPEKLTAITILTYIYMMNPPLREQQLIQIFNNLCEYKNWVLK